MSRAVKIISIYSIALLAVFTGCTKSTPDIVLPERPALEGNEQNSGLLYEIRDGGFIISRSLRNQYLLLYKKYCKHLNKKKSEGNDVLTEVYIITDEGMMDLLKMKTWEKNPWLIEELEK